jgi:phosphohistidine swiveling domain-containing protein
MTSSGTSCTRGTSSRSAASRSSPGRCARSAGRTTPATGCATPCTSARAWCPPASPPLDDAQTRGAQLGAEIVGVPPTRGSINRLAGELQSAYDHFDTLDLASLDHDQLWAALRDAYAFHRRAWFIHFEVMYVLTANYLAFYSLAEEIGLEGSQVSAFLSGRPTFYSKTDEELWNLARRATELGVHDPLRRADPAEVRTHIQNLPNGSAWLSQFDAFLAAYGQRTEETCRVDTPSWIEDPSPALYAIGSFLARPAGFDFGKAREAAIAERDERIEDARRSLRGADLQCFDEALASNQAANFAWWNEEHNYLIDRRAAIPIRRATLELGARLAADGVIGQPDDLFFLFKPSGRARTARGRSAASPPPRAPSRASPRWSPPSPTCRRWEPGDILVCGGTTTEWTPVFGIIGACVCDTGGSLTHAAIVSREYGIPCVVGTAIATQAIKTGDRIRVDGRAGTVHVFPG